MDGRATANCMATTRSAEGYSAPIRYIAQKHLPNFGYFANRKIHRIGV